jgi:histidinol-phosphate phosphatase family protein
MSFDVVIPTSGRPSLAHLLEALDRADGGPRRLIVVDDRRDQGTPLPVPESVEVVPGAARGPAAARNKGWRAATADWVAFLDDDVITPPDWPAALHRDLGDLPATVAASQGQIVVPLASDRRPTDWERNVAGLQTARWATADMAIRRSALQLVDGFDERFRRAYREDSDLALRMIDAGFSLRTGARYVIHPVGSARPGVSVRLQAGNADDALMRVVHGRDWRRRAGAPRGRLRRHALTTAAGIGAVTARRRALRGLSGGLWLASTAEFAWRRIAPGPRNRTEIARMLWTSALIPPAATFHRARGLARARFLKSAPGTRPDVSARPPLAVLLDRDGTLIEDVPYNGDPDRVRAMPGADAAVERLRAAGVKLAVVSNQAAIGRGLITRGQVAAVNARVEELLGPLGPWLICPHDPAAGCACRKPAPGLVIQAAQRLDVPVGRCAVVGDIGSDVEAAHRAGARAVLVPTARTRRKEVDAAPEVEASLGHAVDRLLGQSPTPSAGR